MSLRDIAESWYYNELTPAQRAQQRQASRKSPTKGSAAPLSDPYTARKDIHARTQGRAGVDQPRDPARVVANKAGDRAFKEQPGVHVSGDPRLRAKLTKRLLVRKVAARQSGKTDPVMKTLGVQESNLSLYDQVFESRDQRMGTHKGKTHSSGHPLAPIKAGFSTGSGASAMAASAFEKAERKAKRRGERQTARREAEKEASPVPARKPIFKTGKTERERGKDQAKAWFGGDKASMARTKKLSKWVDYTNLSRARRERDATTRAGAGKKPLTPEEADKTLKHRKHFANAVKNSDKMNKLFVRRRAEREAQDEKEYRETIGASRSRTRVESIERTPLAEGTLGAARAERKAKAVAKETEVKTRAALAARTRGESDPKFWDEHHPAQRFVKQAAERAAAEVKKKSERGGSAEARTVERLRAQDAHHQADRGRGHYDDHYAARSFAHAARQGQPIGGLGSTEAGAWGGPFSPKARDKSKHAEIQRAVRRVKEAPGAAPPHSTHSMIARANATRTRLLKDKKARQVGESVDLSRTTLVLAEAGLKKLERRGQTYTHTRLRSVPPDGVKLHDTTPASTTNAKSAQAAYKSASADLRYFAKEGGAPLKTPDEAKALAAKHVQSWAKYTKPKAAAQAGQPGADPRYGGHGWRKTTTGERRAEKRSRAGGS